VFAYCHDSVGIGHLSRTLSICDRVGRTYPFSSFLIATGTPYVPLFQHLQRVDYIKLPALAKEAPHEYRSKFLPIAPNHLIDYRKAVLRDTVDHFDPEIVLVDKAPIGVCGELLPGLRWLRQNRPNVRIIFGMRDIEDAPEETITHWNEKGIIEALDECFDEIWVYGEQSVFDVVKEYRLPPAIQNKLSFMGYITRGPCSHVSNRTGDPTVLVTVGGGTDGQFLLEQYLDDAAETVASLGFRSVVIGGPDLPARAAEGLRKRAGLIRDVEWLDFEPCMNCRIRAADLVVSMGGYNTMCQLVSNRARTLIVPRIKPRLEQAIRAEVWSKRGLVHVAHPTGLKPRQLTARILEVLNAGRPGWGGVLDFDGLDRVNARFGSFWNAEVPRAASVCM